MFVDGRHRSSSSSHGRRVLHREVVAAVPVEATKAAIAKSWPALSDQRRGHGCSRRDARRKRGGIWGDRVSLAIGIAL